MITSIFFKTDSTTRHSRKRNSEYLPQRDAKAAKVGDNGSTWLVKITIFPCRIERAWRLGANNNRIRKLSISKKFARVAQIFNYSSTKRADIFNFSLYDLCPTIV